MTVITPHFVPKVSRLETTYGHGPRGKLLEAHPRQLAAKTIKLYDVIFKKDGISDSEKLKRVAQGDMAAMRVMSGKLTNLVTMTNHIVAQTDEHLNVARMTHQRKWIDRTNKWIDLINERIETVNECIQAGSSNGQWSGISDTNFAEDAARALAAIERTQNRDTQRSDTLSYREKRLLAQSGFQRDLMSIIVPVLLVLASTIVLHFVAKIAPADEMMRFFVLLTMTLGIVVCVLFVSDKIIWRDQ